MNKLNFRTPVTNNTNSLNNFFEDYFYLSGRKAFAIDRWTVDGKQLVVIKDFHQNPFKRIFLTAFKIATYITGIIPLLMLFAKIVIRSTNSFYVVNPEKPKNNGKEFFVFGDIHGELDGFKENLLHAQVIDKSGNLRKDFKGTIIQMGDVVDRGPKSKEAWAYLGRLQLQAKKNKDCKVIRLLGNHELMLLQGNYGFANYWFPSLFASTIKKDILAGRVQLAYFDNKRLYTHAGLRSKIRNILIEEIKEKKKLKKVTTADITNYLNEVLKEAVKNNNFTHPIFDASVLRGGENSVGGPLWEDIKGLMGSKRARRIPQVIAHNPPRGNDSPIRITPSMRIINVDAGLCKNYGGNQAFVKIDNSQINVFARIGNIWRSRRRDDTVLAS